MWRIKLPDPFAPLYQAINGQFTHEAFNARIYNSEQRETVKLPDDAEWEAVS